jgi:hypothetical protein
MKSLANILDNKSLKERLNLENLKPSRLFPVEPNWTALREKKCPICNTKLTFMRNQPKAYCRGKRHGNFEPFFINVDKLPVL